MRLVLALAAVLLAGCGDDAPPAPPPTPEPPPVEVAASSTLAGAIQASQRLTSFARLVETADLTSMLSDTSSAYTVFAPTDEAIQAAGLDLEVAPDEARQIVLSHVLTTRMMSIDVFPDLSIETAGGTEVSFADTGEGLSVVGSGGTGRIVEADQDTGNGVVHLIDSLLSR